MKALVTGAAGFVGSHLCSSLLDQGVEVRAVDCLTDYYEMERKEANLAPLLVRNGFTFVKADLTVAPVEMLLDDVDVVYHLAGQPGVRPSWGAEFKDYILNNVLATQRLLEAAQHCSLRKLVYASSSSIYGDAECLPTPETVLPRPVSPYGVTKLAAEHLCELYRVKLGVPAVSLRLFTVYGPRQRPDMAFHRLVAAAVHGTPFELLGDGQQTRDFTYVEDVVAAMQAAAASEWCGVANIGGGSRVSMNSIISLVESMAGPVAITRHQAVRGDVRHTAADVTVAVREFGYAPRTTASEGLAAMLAWAVEERYEAAL